MGGTPPQMLKKNPCSTEEAEASNSRIISPTSTHRMARDSPLLDRLIKAGYHVEPCVVAPDTTAIVEFPVAAGKKIRTTRDVSMWEQLSLAAFMQRYWADNQV